jgi:hypothetical protein
VLHFLPLLSFVMYVFDMLMTITEPHIHLWSVFSFYLFWPLFEINYVFLKQIMKPKTISILPPFRFPNLNTSTFSLKGIISNINLSHYLKTFL